MPRNSSGNYTLPAGNPVVPNTLIETNWANPTLADVATALTESLDRFGRGSMLAPLLLADGTQIAPAFAFNSEASTGLYHPATAELAVSVTGSQVALFEPSGVTVFQDLTVQGATTFAGDLGITGNVTLTGDLDVTGTTTTDLLDVVTNATVGGTLGVTGLATLGSLTVTAATVLAALTVSGLFAANGGVVLGDAAADALTINSDTATIPGGLNFAGGNLGINVPVPVARLDVGGAINLADGQALQWAGGSSVRIAGNNAAGVFGIYTANTEQVRVNSLGNVGVGTTSPDSRLTVSGNAAAPPTLPAGSLVHLVGADATGARVIQDVAAGNATFTGRRSNGTIAAPTTVAADNLLASFGGSGYDGAAWSAVQEGFFGIRASEAWTGSAHGAYLFWGTTPNGSTVALERARLDAAGNVGVGTVPSAWGGVFSAGGAIEQRAYTVASHNSAPQAYQGGNIFHDGANWRRKLAGFGILTSYECSAGSLRFASAPTGAAGTVAAITDALIFDIPTNVWNFVSGSGSIRVGGHITRANVQAPGAPTLGVSNFTHGGTRVPDYFEIVARCIVAGDGFAVGDEARLVPGEPDFGTVLSSYATSSIISMFASGQIIILSPTGAGIDVVVQGARYRLVAKAIWL